MEHGKYRKMNGKDMSKSMPVKKMPMKMMSEKDMNAHMNMGKRK